MAEFENDTPEERLLHEAEELMRQRRFTDAVGRYQNLRRFSPTDLFASLGHASALELAGRINEAEQVLEEATVSHRRSAPLHRFRHLFFERREDFPRAQSSARALHQEVMEDGPEDQLADLYFNQGRYHEARAELERLLRESRLDENAELRASVLARIGACLRQGGDHDTARERLLEAIALDSDYHWARSELAEVERALGNVEAARRRYLETLAAQPDDHWCRGHLAQLEYEDGNHERAAALYREILTRAPKAVWAKVELAQVLADKDMAEAVRLCRSAIDDDATYPMAHAQLGNLARREGRYDDAREHYRQALSNAPNNTWVLHELAEICRHLGRLQEAYVHLEHARNVEPYEATTYGYFADLLRHEGKHAAAMQHLEKAVELDDAYAWAWRELAELRALDGRHANAETAYRKACDLEPDEAINDGLKAFLLRCAGRREAALPYLERAVEKQADYLWAWREQVEHHLSRHQPALAEETARRGLVALPESPSLHGLLAEALRRQGRRGEARAPLTKALALAPNSAQLHALDAELRVEDGDHAGAATAVQRAITSEDAPEYRALHAQILIASDRHGEAEAVVRTLISAAKAIAPAYELSAALAEHAGDLPGAMLWCDRGLGAHAGDLRLTVRRARLGLAAGETDAGDRLLPLLDQAGPMPWRDIAQILAQSGRAVLARRAAYHYIAALPAAAEDKARGWLHLAELELGLGNLPESQQALDRALALDPECVPGQILGAVLADQRGDLPGAIAFLADIDRRLHERTPGSSDDEPTESALLLRQLASLYERARRHDDAARCWARITAEAGDQPGYRCDHAAWLLRQGRLDEGRLAAETVLANTPADLPEGQRLLRELAITTTNRLGAKAGLAALATWRDRLGAANRLLFAQLALTAGDYLLARGQLDQVLADPSGDHRAARLLGVRQSLATHDLPGAEREADALASADPDDEEAAALHGEALALQQHFTAAFAALTPARLPARPNLERGLLIAMVRGEQDGEAALLAGLGRVLPNDHPSPLSRLFATAWPTAWAGGSQPASNDDVLCLPPFPRLAGIVAPALAGQGRRDLAITLALSVANAVGGPSARILRRLAIPWLRHLGRRGMALRLAWTLRSPNALWQALVW